MVDPLAEVVALLRPTPDLSKTVTAAGQWRIHRTEVGRPYYCVVLSGSCCLTPEGHERVELDAGDFVLIPAASSFTVTSAAPPADDTVDVPPVPVGDGEFRLGVQGCDPDVVMLVGYCRFGSPDAGLLVSLLPKLVHVRGEKRLETLVQLVGDESRQRRPARDVILGRLLEVLLLEALRSTGATATSPGLLRGLGDARLATALRSMHADTAHPWTIAELAKVAALSRSVFFERFRNAVGVPPMEYLLAWRMALAKSLLRPGGGRVSDVAERVGYSSPSTFSVAFTRYVGVPPARYAQSLPH